MKPFSRLMSQTYLTRARKKVAVHFEPVMKANYKLVAPPPKRPTVIGGYKKVASYDRLGEQLHYSNPVKQGSFTFTSIWLAVA